MRIEEKSLPYLDKIGVYKITNILVNKVYIGSTKKSFISRFSTHYQKLKSNNHKGHPHLQSSVNKHGIENFEFSIVETCEIEDCISREEYWIGFYDATNREKGYNSKKEPKGSPMLEKEIREKMTNTIRYLYSSGKLKPNSTVFKKGIIPWNKGSKYKSTDHLKVPKKKRGSRKNFSKTVKEKQLPIEVFDKNMIKLGEWRYIEDLVKDTQSESSILKSHMKLVNPNGRNGYDAYRLSRFNVQKSCNKGVMYKGLNFRYKKEVHFKQGELLETPKMDNQQPSLDSNILEGSTTNSRVLTSNVEDSNADTSALPIIKSEEIVIERDKNGNPVMSAYYTIIDLNNSDDIV